MSTFEVVIFILVAIHTQSLRPHLNVQKTLYLVNLFRIKFEVTLDIGVLEVGGKRIAACMHIRVSILKGEQLPGQVRNWSHHTAALKKNLQKSNTVFCIIIFFFILTVPFKKCRIMFE